MVEGAPVGKARPRVTRRVTYTPAKTSHYEDLVRYSATSNFTGLNLLIDTLKNKSFFDNEIVNTYEIPNIFDFNRKCKYMFGWDDYINRYSIAHQEYKKLKKLLYPNRHKLNLLI